MASLAGLAYGLIFSHRAGGPARMLLKVSGVVILAGTGLAAGGPWLLWAALLASAAGDGFLAGRPERWLLPGMAAFFLAHVFYVALFWQLGHGDGAWSLTVKIGQAALVLGGAFYIRWLVPWIVRPMRLPVSLYGAVILMMGAAAIALPAAFWPVTVGALMFIASDGILAYQLFCRPPDAPAQRPASYAVWFLYFLGQAAIMLGVVSIPA
ncbi:MAG: lysoplasmalogenase family protein [Hyphomonas sp.]